jgi:fluoride exporter
VHDRECIGGEGWVELIWIGIGGALGAIGRYLVGREFTERVGGLFPWGTFAVNITGALLIGVVFALLTERGTGDDHLRLLLVVGILGGYTTFSSYALEVVNLVEAGHGGTALVYVLGSNLLAMVACVVGIAMTRWAT